MRPLGPQLLVCPVCGGSLLAHSPGGDALRCPSCPREYCCDEGVVRLFWPTECPPDGDVTDTVKAFYEQTPFPDYEALETTASLKDKACRGGFARLLDAQIGDRARVLEVGCGTGQLSNFLALAPGRTVVATDMCLNSLRLAQGFKTRNRLENVTFVQMNLFRPSLEPAAFDIVICSGVLHHTSDPRRGLEVLSRLVRPSGFLVVGLYNWLGRLPTLFRGLLLRLGGDRLAVLDPRLRSLGIGEARKRAWLADQYRHPHESRHGITEVQRWFDATGLEFVGSIPRSRPFHPFHDDEPLFETGARGSAFEHVLVELGMLLRGGTEGGLFVMIGRRPA